jgi:excisionase family DNA binding protein
VTGRLLTPEDLGLRFGVPKTHVWRLAREGHLPTVRLGRYVRFDPEQVREFERRGGTVRVDTPGRI